MRAFVPWAGLLGRAAQAAAVIGAIVLLVTAYLASVELSKRFALCSAA